MGTVVGPLMGGGKCNLSPEPSFTDLSKGSHKAHTPAGGGYFGSTFL